MMDPALALQFQREKERHGGTHFTFDLGLIYRGKARAYLDEGVVADDLFYVEVKDWGLSHFYVTGPEAAVVHYAMRIRSWIDRVKEAERLERIREGAERLRIEHERRQRWKWLRGLFGLAQ